MPCCAVQEEVSGKGYTVLTPRVRLDTPGKASVEVVILADPDGHEVGPGPLFGRSPNFLHLTSYAYR